MWGTSQACAVDDHINYNTLDTIHELRVERDGSCYSKHPKFESRPRILFYGTGMSNLCSVGLMQTVAELNKKYYCNQSNVLLARIILFCILLSAFSFFSTYRPFRDPASI